MKLVIEENNNETISNKAIDIKQLQKAYKEVFATEAGRLVFEDLAGMSGMYRTNFVQNNMHHTSFLEGQRSLFLYICAYLTAEQTDNIKGNSD